MAAQRPGQRASERIGAVVATEQRHCDRAVFGQCDDRRLGPLVVKQRADRPDQNAARADADNRRSGGEQRGDLRHRAIVGHVPIAGAMARTIEPGSRQQVAHPSPKRGATRAEYQDCSAGRQPAHRITSPRQTSAIAKYGTSAGSTADNGAIRWFGKVARSTYIAWSDNPSLSSTRRSFAKWRPILMTAAISLAASRRASSSSASVAGMTDSVASRCTSGRPTAAAQAVSGETPGTTVTR